MPQLHYRSRSLNSDLDDDDDVGLREKCSPVSGAVIGGCIFLVVLAFDL